MWSPSSRRARARGSIQSSTVRPRESGDPGRRIVESEHLGSRFRGNERLCRAHNSYPYISCEFLALVLLSPDDKRPRES
jgi:hypothetical protein